MVERQVPLNDSLPPELNAQPDDEVSSEVLEHPSVESETSVVRFIALQALYEIDMTDHPVGEVVNYLVEDFVFDDERSAPYLQTLVLGVKEHRQQIDDVLARFANEFPIQQLATIDRNILRIAVLEFLVLRTTGVRVAINEAVEMAKRFGTDASPRFVNGVLGAIARRAFPDDEDDSDTPTPDTHDDEDTVA
jgi:N utilization substance protein B